MLLLRDPLEVLMILRHENSSFVPSAWVFPGGAVDPDDGPPDDLETFRRAAIREVEEETSIQLNGELVWTSRWITPIGMPKRFDTRFFVTKVRAGVVVALQETEATDYRWITPADALAQYKAGEFPMVFPTIKNLEALAAFTSADDAIAARRGAKIEAVQPILVVDGNRRKIVLP